MVRLLAVAAVMLVGAGCAAPKEGEGCSSTGFVCGDGAAALECSPTSKKWVKIPCRGANGCKREVDPNTKADIIRCDISSAVEGDGCASNSEGKGLCTSDGKAALECRGSTLTKLYDCTSCFVDGGTVVCK